MAPLKMGEGTEEGGIQAPYWAPTAPGTRTRKMSSHHVCLWKSAGLHLESQKSTGNGDSALRGLHTALLALRPSTESTVGKVHGPRVKEIGGVTLGHVLGGTGMHRNFHQEWKRWQEPFSLSSFSLAGLSLALFWHSPPALLAPLTQLRCSPADLPSPTHLPQQGHAQPTASAGTSAPPHCLAPQEGRRQPYHQHACNSCSHVLQPATPGAHPTH